jgi:hypothetical protein
MRVKSILLLVASIIVLLVPEISNAEDVTGCPLGIKKGEIWIKASLKYDDMRERYTREADEMVNLEKGEHNWAYALGIRFGYGITDRWDVGILFPYKWVDKKIYNKKAKKWSEVENDGLGELWFGSRYKFFYGENIGVFDEIHLNLGAGFKVPLSDSDKIKHGIGNGANEFRIVILYHDHIGRFGFCNHLFYNWRSIADKMAGWKFSDQDLTDRLNYKLNLEFDLFGSGMFEVTVGAVGWFDIENVELAEGFENQGMDGMKAHNHAVMPGIELKPFGEKYEHRKFALKLRIPYRVKVNYAPDYTLTAIAMWTF